MRRRGMALAFLCVLAAAPSALAAHWIPPPRLTWYWQLTGQVGTRTPAAAYDIDGFESTPGEVAALHHLGRHVICYIDAGTWEEWRPDAHRFPSAVLGRPNGWPGERWLDIRRLAVIEPIMRARVAMCARKGFDALEPDNIAGFENRTGFPITGRAQLAYDEWIARQAHRLGLAVFEKNDPRQASQLEPFFDGVLEEQRRQYRECSAFAVYLRAGKPVLDAEYSRRLYPDFCRADASVGMMGALYNSALDGRVYEPCWAAQADLRL